MQGDLNTSDAPVRQKPDAQGMDLVRDHSDAAFAELVPIYMPIEVLAVGKVK